MTYIIPSLSLTSAVLLSLIIVTMMERSIARLYPSIKGKNKIKKIEFFILAFIQTVLLGIGIFGVCIKYRPPRLFDIINLLIPIVIGFIGILLYMVIKKKKAKVRLNSSDDG
jgi:DMSO reductase anchor subunit